MINTIASTYSKFIVLLKSDNIYPNRDKWTVMIDPVYSKLLKVCLRTQSYTGLLQTTIITQISRPNIKIPHTGDIESLNRCGS